MRANVKPKCVAEGYCSKTIDWWRPAWSPDGKRLAVMGSFENGRLNGDTRAYIRETGGRTKALFVSDVGTGGVAWSPDGGWLAHDSGRDYPQVILIGVRTGKAHAVADLGLNAAWSPDGERLAFHYARGTGSDGLPIWRGIATVRRDGSSLKRLKQAGDDPDWSPDGKRIAFASSGIRTVNGAGRVVLLARSGGNPSWSPDGSRIVFERGEDLWIMDGNGSHLRLLVMNGRAPDWSPAKGG